MSKLSLAEYIWLDGDHPTQGLRSKARVVEVGDAPGAQDFPDWNFDGSSTNQAEGHDSDCILKPVRALPDPIRDSGSYLVLCEVLNPDGTPHASNHRAILRAVLDSAGAVEPWVGFEQEYTLLNNGRPLGWPEHGFPAPQGLGVAAVGVFTCAFSLIIWNLLKLTLGIRLGRVHEERGGDLTEVGLKAYNIH